MEKFSLVTVRFNFGNLTDGHDVTTYAHFWWDDEYRGDMFAWNSQLKYPDDYDPIDHFEQRSIILRTKKPFN